MPGEPGFINEAAGIQKDEASEAPAKMGFMLIDSAAALRAECTV